MSTIEKILLSLQANGNDKKDTLTNSYQEKSVWLRNEFDVIRKLIKQNPRENLTNQEVESDAVAPVVSSSSSAREQSGDGRKRKSPETVNAVKLSPQQKRASIDVDDLVHQAGLPSDLNKMKKEHLLAELEKRGNTQFSMKNVKNALIDALKDTLLSEYQNRDAPEQPILQNAESTPAEPESTSMVMSTPSKPAPMRGSLMADFRSLVQNGNAGASTENSSAPAKPEAAAEEQKKRIETEYNARMHRQRESVAARQSILNVEASAKPVTSTAAVEEKVEVAAPTPAPAPVAAPVLSLEAPSSVASKDSIGSTASEGSIWMEVSSPVRTSAPEAATTEEEEEPAVAAVVESATAVRSRAGSDASFQSCASTGSNVPKSMLSSASTSAKNSAPTSATASHSSVRPLASKTSSYNTEKPGVAKSVAPSLMKAKLGSKPAEEVRPATALLAKKAPLPENKPSSAKIVSASVSAPAQSVRPVTAPTAAAPAASAPAVVAAPVAVHVTPVPIPAAAPVPVAAAPSAAGVDSAATANAAPAKRGIFGFLSNSKKNITATPAANAATPGGAPLSNSGLFSPSAQSTSAKSAAPAMVDSIIKSAKMDSVVVAPFSTSTTTPSAPKPVASEQQALSNSGKMTASAASTPGSAAAPLKNAFASKSLISNIVDNYNNAVKTPVGLPAPVAATAAAVPTPAAVVSAPASKPAAPVAGVLRDITATTNAPATASKPVASVASVAHPAAAVPATPVSHAQPAAAVAPAASSSVEVNEYVIEDRDDSDESGTDGEGEGEESKKPKQNVPEWARGPLLKEALERQYGLGGQVPMDPDLIFPEVTTCSLEEIFGAREGLSRKYAARSSSAHWDADQMTLVEKRSYRKHMGYDRGQQAAAGAMIGSK